MSPPSLIARSWIEAVDARWPGLRRRAGPIVLALLVEFLLLLALLSLGAVGGDSQQPLGQIVTTFDAAPDAAPEPEEPEARPASAASAQTALPAPSPPGALPSPPPVALPRAPTAPPVAPPAPPAEAPPSPAPPRIRAVIRSDMGSSRGPADTGARDGDSQRIAGSGPNGEPLYAAKWYREPSDEEYRGYFSRVTGSGWALINCRTEPEFRVDDCVLVDESDRSVGSAVLAMAWQFRVRPPRVGGRSLVGEWVRIRIDYIVKRQ